MDVLGYRLCASETCNNQVLDAVAHATGGFCTDCAVGGRLRDYEHVIVSVDGGQVHVDATKRPQTARNRRQYLRRKGSETLKRRKHAAEKAKIAAWKRLATLAPELYQLILADERHKRGLTPIAAHSAVRKACGDVAWETLDLLAFYRALSSQEHAPDDPHDATPDPHTARN